MTRLPIAFVVSISLVATVSAGEVLPEPGALLREGVWDGGVGTYSVPQSFATLKPSVWPRDGWHRIEIRANGIVAQPASVEGKLPVFLKSIVTQFEAPPAEPTPPASEEVPNVFYLRVPGVTLAKGTLPAYRFQNGTIALRPILDRRYELEFAGKPFAFRVQNGLRGKTGEAYGDGAQYAIEYGGNTYAYSLGEFGWDSTIQAIADLDGDGRPDFLVNVGGNNSGFEAVLLSSKAKPGPNPATASLKQTGC